MSDPVRVGPRRKTAEEIHTDAKEYGRYVAHQIAAASQGEPASDPPTPNSVSGSSKLGVEGDPPHTHELKVWPQFFGPILSGVKTFEYRKDDREPRFAVGDVLVLHEYTPPYRAETDHEWSKSFGGDYTGRGVRRRVTYIARDTPLIPDGFCVMAIEPIRRPVEGAGAATTECPVCGKGSVAIVTATKPGQWGDNPEVHFTDTLTRCADCGEEWYEADQSRQHFRALMRATIESLRASLSSTRDELARIQQALDATGIGGIMDIFADPADAIIQMALHIRDMEARTAHAEGSLSSLRDEVAGMRGYSYAPASASQVAHMHRETNPEGAEYLDRGAVLSSIDRARQNEGGQKENAKPDDQQNADADALTTMLPTGGSTAAKVAAKTDNGVGVTSRGGESGLPYRAPLPLSGNQVRIKKQQKVTDDHRIRMTYQVVIECGKGHRRAVAIRAAVAKFLRELRAPLPKEQK